MNIEQYIEKVKPIVDDVRVKGDEALFSYTLEIDKVRLSSLVISHTKLREIASELKYRDRELIDLAIRRVVEVNRNLVPCSRIIVENSHIMEFRFIPIEKVGLYVPRGYISTLIMLGALARVSGCRDIIVATPPLSPERPISPHMAYAALRLGISKVITANGVASIAALAFGTRSVPRVYKIFGPGNMYVQAAKYLVSKYVDIDGIEGPTELMLLVGNDSPESYSKIVLDVLAELEHGSSSIAVVISENQEFLKLVEHYYREYSSKTSLGLLYTVLVDKLEDAVHLVNEVAPEHVEIYSSPVRARKIARMVINAGIVSINTPCTYMDYCAGICHVLPTGGFARSRGCLSPLDFMKLVPLHEGYLNELLDIGIALAELENMYIHLESLKTRRK